MEGRLVVDACACSLGTVLLGAPAAGIVAGIFVNPAEDHEVLAVPTATANPGNVHICLEVVDADSIRDKAISLGAKPVSTSVIEVTQGPNAGARVCYLRDPDGITFEFFQKP